MNERTNSHQDQTSDAQQEISRNAEEGKMQTKQNKNENKFQVAYQEILKVKEGFEMKVTKPITNVTTRISQGLGSKTPAKVLGGLAVGALMLAATGLAIETGQASSGLGGGIPDDEWMFNSPYHQDFAKMARV